jgi:hypothetical protein
MNIYSSLLFMHGHIANAALATRLATPVPDADAGAGAGEPAAGGPRPVVRPARASAVALLPGAAPGCPREQEG